MIHHADRDVFAAETMLLRLGNLALVTTFNDVEQ